MFEDEPDGIKEFAEGLGLFFDYNERVYRDRSGGFGMTQQELFERYRDSYLRTNGSIMPLRPRRSDIYGQEVMDAIRLGFNTIPPISVEKTVFLGTPAVPLSATATPKNAPSKEKINMPSALDIPNDCIVQVTYPGSSRVYTYNAQGCVAGDYVIVGPTPITDKPQVLQVLGIGRIKNGYVGPLKTAVRVPMELLV